MQPTTITKELNRVHSALQSEGLERLIPFLDNSKYICSELHTVLDKKRKEDDDINVDLLWIYVQYNKEMLKQLRQPA